MFHKVKKRWALALLVVFLLIVTSATTILRIIFSKETPEVKDKNEIAIIALELDGVTLSEVNDGDKDIQYNVRMSVEEDNERTLSLDGLLKGRGNSTWNTEKKPYRLKFDQRINLFGLGYSKSWVLLANYYDDSCLRNDLANYLINAIGSDYVLKGKFAKLIVNGEDVGLYYVMQPVGIRKGMVRLKDEMGILMELDNLYYKLEDEYYESGNGDNFVVKEVLVEDNRNEAVEQFMNKYNRLEELIREKDYEKIKEIVDVESLAKYYLITELSNNPDGFFSNWYFYIDGAEDKIHLGPMWDFDLAFGSEKWVAPERMEGFFSPLNVMTRRDDILFEDGGRKERPTSALIYNLMDIDEFRELIRKIYVEKLYGKSGEIVEYVRNVADEIRTEAMMDNWKWNKGDYDDAVSYLVWWIEQRCWMMDVVYGRNGLLLDLRAVNKI